MRYALGDPFDVGNLNHEPFLPYVPVWTDASGAPALGNGTLTGSYLKMGRLVLFTADFAWGTTTDAAGTTNWYFSTPTPIARFGGGSGAIYQGVLNQMQLAVLTPQSAAAFRVTSDYSPDGSVSATWPFVWTSFAGSKLWARGWYWEA